MKIFEEFGLGRLVIKNRLVRSAVYEFAGDDGRMNERYKEIYRKLAAGGCGLIISGHQAVCPGGRAGAAMIECTYDDYENDLRDIAEEAHRNNAKFIVQLQHAGPKCALNDHGDGIAVSAVEMNGHLFREASLEDIERIKKCFVEAALRVKNAGCDGVQIHSTHGYLLNTFLSPSTNHRHDRYGGNIENRSRLLFEIYQGIREAVGPDFCIMTKISYSDLIEETSKPEEIRWVCRKLEEMGIDGIEISAGMTNDGSKMSFDPFVRKGTEGYFRAFAEDIANTVNIPVISVCAYRSKAFAEKTLNETKITAISFGRPLIREPDLVNKWQSSDEDALCISCNKCFKSGQYGTLGCHVYD